MQNPTEDSDIQQFAAGGCSTATDLLKTALAPRKNSCAPPNFHQDSNFNKKLDMVLNFNTTPPAVPGAVNRSDGMILWLVNYGANSIFHMGFVPPTCVELAIAPSAALNGAPRNVIAGYLLSLTYTAPLALPYNMRTTTDNQFVISPNLSDNFSKTRMTSGVIDVKSTTLPGGAVNLNGLLAAGSLSDTRDVAQNGPVASTATAYSVVDLAQSSVTKKDGLREVAIYDGVASIIGPDIPPDYTAPNINDTFQRNGEYSVHRITNTLTVTLQRGGGAAETPLNIWLPSFTGSISPWRVTAQWNAAAGGIGNAGGVLNPTPVAVNNTIFTNPIDETGSLSFIFAGRYSWGNISGAISTLNLNNVYQTRLVISHFYASVDNDGKIYHYQVDEVHQLDYRDHYADPAAPAINQMAYETFQIQSSPDFFTASFVGAPDPVTGVFQGGKYVCTTFAFVSSIASFGNTNPQRLAIVVSDCTVSVSAPTVAVRGAVGPARVIRYDNVSTDQNIRFNGMANVQCIPQGNLAPFTQSAAMFNREALNVNVMPWLAAMFNGPLALSRNWTLSDYEEMVKKIDDVTSTEGLTKMGKIDPRMGSAMQAAGLLSRMSKPVASGAIGGVLGGMSESLFGAHGQLSTGASSSMASSVQFHPATSNFEEDAKRYELERQREEKAGARRARD